MIINRISGLYVALVRVMVPPINFALFSAQVATNHCNWLYRLSESLFGWAVFCYAKYNSVLPILVRECF